MKKVTALRSRNGRGKQVRVYLDGEFAFSLEAEVAAKGGLAVGQELAVGRLEELARANEFQRCLNAAVHYLSYRPRSEFELRERLQRRGFAADDIEDVMARLKERGVVDDGEFARFWRDNRQAFRPRSRALTRLELRRKGVGDEVIGQVLGAVDDADSAERAARVKARRLPLTDYKIFRRRLGEYLRRRGFGYTVISNTVEQLWREMGETGSE